MKTASRILCARGRSIVEFEMKRPYPDDEAILKQVLGPTGNLRAPALRVGGTIVVGYEEGLYRQALAARGPRAVGS